MRYIISLIFLFPSVCFSYTYEEAKNIISQYTHFETDHEDCEKYTSYDGMYFFGGNRLIICEKNIIHNHTSSNINKIKLETLLHEAVHLAQDCASGLENDVITPITHNTKSNAYVKNLIKKRYKNEFIGVEIEAWSYAGSIEPIYLVEKYCAR